MQHIRNRFFIGMLSCYALSVQAQQATLFTNPLGFYNTDILNYLQVLHKNQQYDKMAPFFTGPVKQGLSQAAFEAYLGESPFGYTMKRSGIKQNEKGKKWALTYQRTWLGTTESFKIDCILERDTCRIVLTEAAAKLIFKKE
jgi:hypothetical protein